APTVPEADELVSVFAGALADDGADHRVQPRAVAATRQHADPHPPPPVMHPEVSPSRSLSTRCALNRAAPADRVPARERARARSASGERRRPCGPTKEGRTAGRSGHERARGRAARAGGDDGRAARRRRAGPPGGAGMTVLAIDAGTTGVTALVVSEAGRVVARGYREFPQLFPRPG